ncbi:class I SAM-dependent methyltransferase [Salinibacter ruber]|uniref:class I SAM-dependent methyltransferase n=1 Tax=Salinibacter ruber TaxID=146919 RepID=UPI00216AA2D5|nr:class I SAM-dependent methyltransferase [Salinibacter ruber]MCS4198123.1 putative O-methyltransferase YrrM [Salinibacter ruber]
MKIVNIIKQATKIERAKVLVNKVIKRITKKVRGESDSKVKSLAEKKITDWRSYCKSTNKEIYDESRNFEDKIKKRSDRVLSDLDVELGGGGNYVLLYFLTRLTKPSCVIETGVAAGFSSCAFLEAMSKNGKGHLYSSDFPYFRLKDPEKYIGILVEENLKRRWHLFTEGDQNNIPKIKRKIDKVDIIHYDSDKSYEGRQYVISSLKQKLKKDSIIIYDDILDNDHFYDMYEKLDKSCNVFKFEGKYVGVLGDIKNRI